MTTTTKYKPKHNLLAGAENKAFVQLVTMKELFKLAEDPNGARRYEPIRLLEENCDKNSLRL